MSESTPASAGKLGFVDNLAQHIDYSPGGNRLEESPER